MGNGEVVGNQSVHWKIDHEKGTKKPTVNTNRADRPTGDDEVNADRQVMGRDPVDPKAIGKGERKGYFNVRLRFDSPAEANAELQKAARTIKEDGAGHWYVVLDVRAVIRAHADDKPPAEVRIDW